MLGKIGFTQQKLVIIRDAENEQLGVILVQQNLLCTKDVTDRPVLSKLSASHPVTLFDRPSESEVFPLFIIESSKYLSRVRVENTGFQRDRHD